MVIQAAGGVLWRRSERSVEVALIHRPRRQDWSLPKGKLDPGESELDAALREVAEETGFEARVGLELGTVRYVVDDEAGPVGKSVRYWALEAGEGTFVPNDEVDRLVWLTPAEGLGRLTYARDREILERFCELMPR